MNLASPSIRFVLLCIAVALLATFTPAQSPNSSSRINQAIDETSRTTLAGTTPKAIQKAQDLGALEGVHSLQRMMLILGPSPEQQASLTNFIGSQHSKGSPDYHNWLTPEQFAARFGPSDDDLAKIKGWLQSQGLNPTGIGRGRQWIEFSGSVQQVNSAFRTSMHQFQSNGQKHIANASDLSIPAALSPVVTGVLSLNDFRKQPAHTGLRTVKRNENGKLAPVTPDFTTLNSNGDYLYYVAPADFQTIYNVSPLLKDKIDGTGISIAVAGRSDIYLTDVQAFRQTFGLPQNDPNFIVNGPDPGFSSRDMSESSLDVEWAGAVAPGATINFVVSGSTETTDGIDLSSAYIVDNATSPIVSVSYGLCEPLMGPAGNQFYNALWQQAAAEGITVFVSTGDVGAAQCDGDLQNAGLEAQGPAQNGPTISGLSSTPFNVAVGGTQFNEQSNYSLYWSANNANGFESALGYITEQAWNESCDPTLPQVGTNCVSGQTSYNLEAGGGGPSNCSQSTVDGQGNVTCIGGYAKPSWQTGTGVPIDGVRDTPDLSLNASPDDDGYLFCIFATCETVSVNGQTVLEQASVVGGTSAAAPTMAGIMALVEQKNGAYQGQANYIFYKLAAMDNLSSCNSSTETDPTQASSCNFNDITLGGNSVPGLPGYGTATAEWSAGVGYDMASGLGTVNAANLAANWSQVSFVGSNTALMANATAAQHGQPLNLGISVTPASGGSGTPSGAVALVTDKYGAVTSVTLDASGNFSGPVSNLPGGSYNLTARYGGDGTFGSSVSAPVAVTMAPESSTTSLQLSTYNPVTNVTAPYSGTTPYGFPLTFNISVVGKSGNGNPSGSVSLLNGSTVITSAPLNSGGATAITTGYGTPFTLPLGADNITVQYSGDNSFAASTSSATALNVAKQQVYTGVGISAYNVPAGQTVFFTGSIISGYVGIFGFPIQIFPVQPTGTMQFFDNGTPLTSALPIVNGTVNYTASLTTPGTHNITAAYSGDSNYLAVSGTDPNYAGPSTFMINPPAGAATVTTLAQTPTTLSFGQSFSYIVSVTPVTKGGPVPTGQVWINGRAGFFNRIVNLVNGQASVVEQPPAGTDTVYAQYQGDSNYAPSTSPIITTTVGKLSPAVSLTSSAPYVLPGDQTSLDFLVQGYIYGTGQSGYYEPQGTVQFFDAVNGGAPQPITAALTLGPVQPQWDSGLATRITLPTGTNLVTAQYSGDSYLNGATTTALTITVTSPDFKVSSNPAALTMAAGGSTTGALTVEPILGFSGEVTLSCGSGLPAGATCSFSPSMVPAKGGTSNLTISMQGPTTAQATDTRLGWLLASGMSGAFGLLLIGFGDRRMMPLAATIIVFATFGLLLGCAGGGGGSQSPTTLLLQSSQAKIASGATLTLTAQASGGNGTPTGSVTFYDGTTALGNAIALSGGSVKLQINNLAVGAHSITAIYSGDSRHAGATSQALYQAITGSTTLQVQASANNLSHTLNITLTVQ